MTDLTEGTLLVATSKLKDAKFLKSVILIIKTNEDFKLGIVINRTLNKTIKLKNLPPSNKNLKYGGPIPGPVVALHHNKECAENTISNEMYYSCGFENINKISNDQLYQFYSGYCTWRKGQLEEEINSGFWTTDKIVNNKIIYEEDEFVWMYLRNNYSKEFYEKIGININKFNYLLN